MYYPNNTTNYAAICLMLLLALVASAIGVKTGNVLFFVIISFLPLAGVFALRFSFLLTLGFVIFSFFRIHEVFPTLYPLKIPQLLALGAIGSFSLLLITKKVKCYWSNEFTWFSIFFLYCTIGIAFASNRPIALEYWTSIYVKIGLMVFIIAWMIQTPRQLIWTMRLIIAAGISLALATINNKLHSIGLVEGTRVTIGRDIGSVLGDPNDLALVLLFSFSFAMSLVLNKGIGFVDRLLGLIAVLAISLAIVYTQSRGGLLGLSAVLGIFAWRRVKSKALLISGGVALLLILFAMAGISDRASGGSHEEGIDESANIRLEAWKAAVSMAIHNPFSGVGLNNYYYNFYFYSDFWDSKNHAVHSTWFGVMAETGFVGFILFILLLHALYRSILYTIRRCSLPDITKAYGSYIPAMSEALLAGAASFLTSGTFLTQGFTWPLYIILALTVSLRHLIEKQEL